MFRSRSLTRVFVAVVVTSCAPIDVPGRTPDRGTLTVFAAASLTEAFDDIADAFETDRPHVDVRFNFGPSDGLATQIIEGAPADVFASASPSWMDAVERDGPPLARRVDFARNSLVIITPRDDPAGIASVTDLSAAGVSIVLAAEGVPAGDYAREMLANAGIAHQALANVVSNEEDVKGVVQKVGGTNLLIARPGRTLVPAQLFNPDSFIAIDQRETTTIQVPDTTRRYRVITRQNLDAAELTAREGTTFKGPIRITKPEEFWAQSRFLILLRVD